MDRAAILGGVAALLVMPPGAASQAGPDSGRCSRRRADRRPSASWPSRARICCGWGRRRDGSGAGVDFARRDTRCTGMTRAFLAAAMVALALSACATREAFDAQQAAFIGRSEAELVAALGVPVRTYDAEGRRFLQYEDRRIVSYPGAAGLGYGLGRWSGLGGYGPRIESRSCDVTFELRDGRVVGFSARGDSCVAAVARTEPTA